MRLIGIRYLADGGWLFEDAATQSLFYRKHAGGKAYEVPYTMTGDQEYVLAGLIKTVGSPGESHPVANEAGAVIAEVTRLLSQDGFPVSVGQGPVGFVPVTSGESA